MTIVATLACTEGPEEGRHAQLPTSGTFTIGRSLGCDLSLDDDNVSRQHARIDVANDGATITDLTSTSGTFVDGERVTSIRLRDRAEIRIGRSVLVYDEMVAPEFEEIAESRPAPPPRAGMSAAALPLPRARSRPDDETTLPSVEAFKPPPAKAKPKPQIEVLAERAVRAGPSPVASLVTAGVLLALLVASALFFPGEPPPPPPKRGETRIPAQRYAAARESSSVALRVKDWARAEQYAKKALALKPGDPAALKIAAEAEKHLAAQHTVAAPKPPATPTSTADAAADAGTQATPPDTPPDASVPPAN